MMLKKIAPAFLLIAASLLVSCSKDKRQRCENKICDASFATLRIQFLESNGQGNYLKIDSYSAVNLRTGDTLVAKEGPKIVIGISPMVPLGSYRIADDSHLKVLSEAGDDIKITGTSQITGQTKTAIVKVAGGDCTCHVQKVSGPDKIQFD